jgi:hypothetical protein
LRVTSSSATAYAHSRAFRASRPLARAAGAGLAAALVGVASLAGCRSPDEPDGEPAVTYTVRLHTGDQQAGPAGSVLDEPLGVTVATPTGEPARAVTVRFRVAVGRGAQLLDTVAVTGPDGVAATRLRVGSEGDTVVVTAAVVRQEALGVRFTARATAPATLAALAPTAFAPGDTVTLRGARFNPAPSGNAVFFGAARGRIVQTSGDSLLRAVVPPCVAGGTVQVQVRLGTATTNVLAGLATDATRALALRALEATTVSGTEAGNCLRLPGDGARYLLIPQFASAGDSTPAQRAFTLGADTGATALPRSHRGGSATGRAVVAPSGRVPGVRERFERMLRATESRLAREGIAEDVARASALAAADRAPGAPLAAQAPDPPALGSERTFRVLTRFDGSAFGNTTARLRYAGDHILLYEDRAAPAPMDDATVRRMGELFDRTLYPIDVRAFGVESDVDGNGRVIVLMTPLVNALTQSASCASEGFVPGLLLRHRPRDPQPELQSRGDLLQLRPRSAGDAQLPALDAGGAPAPAGDVPARVPAHDLVQPARAGAPRQRGGRVAQRGAEPLGRGAGGAALRRALPGADRAGGEHAAPPRLGRPVHPREHRERTALPRGADGELGHDVPRLRHAGGARARRGCSCAGSSRNAARGWCRVSCRPRAPAAATWRRSWASRSPRCSPTSRWRWWSTACRGWRARASGAPPLRGARAARAAHARARAQRALAAHRAAASREWRAGHGHDGPGHLRSLRARRAACRVGGASLRAAVGGARSRRTPRRSWASSGCRRRERGRSTRRAPAP